MPPVAGVIVGSLRILPPPDLRPQVLEILRSVQGPILAQPGCLACHVYKEQSPESAVVLVERWESDAAFATHIRSDLYRRILGACELSSAPPEFRFEEVSTTQGIEVIERLLGTGGPGSEG